MYIHNVQYLTDR